MNEFSALQKIRDQFLKASIPICPNCEHSLTVNKTKYFETHLCENCFTYSKVLPFENCCDNPCHDFVKMIVRNGTVQVRKQCANCGAIQGNSIGGFTQEQKDKLPLADLSKREERDEIVGNAWKDLYDRKQQGIAQSIERSKEDWWEDYKSYLQTPEWKHLRTLVLKRDNYKCQCCLEGMATQVHHKSYEFVDFTGREPCFDLVSICKPCHDQLHEMRKQNRSKS